MTSKTTLFGLPEKVIHCKKCVMTNQTPFVVNESENLNSKKKAGMKMDDDGICDACKYAEKKRNSIDWVEREKLLKNLLDKHRSKNEEYDCIVSVSGGKDSSKLSHILKYKYGMHPLSVTYSPILFTDVGWKNLRSFINVGGFDNVLFSPNGKVVSLLARESFKNLLHPMQPFKFGIKTIAAKYAIKYNIKLVMFGEPYVEYGAEADSNNKVPNFNQSYFINDKKDIYIAGKKISELKKRHQWLSNNDLYPYMPLRSKEVKNKKLAVEFLGWYLPWDPQESYYNASENTGFKLDEERTDSTYARYTGIDDKFDWLHFYCRYIKFGIGRCRVDASQEIRNGHITREEGIMLLKKFESEYPKRYLKDCYDFMGISEEEAMNIFDKFRSPHLWEKKKKKWFRKQELPELFK